MILTPINRALLGSCMTAFVVCAGWPDIAAQEQSVEGVFALPDVEPLVSGEMTLQETGPLSRELQLVYTDLSTGKQIPKFDVELTQELHILATDAGLLLREHRGSALGFLARFEKMGAAAGVGEMAGPAAREP